MKTPKVEPVILDPEYTINKGKPTVQAVSISKADIDKMKKAAIVELVSLDPTCPMLAYNVEFIKAQFDMFGGTAPEVPPVDAPNPKVERMNALSMEHKQMYNGLIGKQKKNLLLPEEKGHLQMFNNYLSGSHSHEQLKGYIGYKQNEAHLPLFGNAPKVESPAVKTPEAPKIDAPEKSSQHLENLKTSPHGIHHALRKEYNETEDKSKIAEKVSNYFSGDKDGLTREGIISALDRAKGLNLVVTDRSTENLKKEIQGWVDQHTKNEKLFENIRQPKVESPVVKTPEAPKVELPQNNISDIVGEHEMNKLTKEGYTVEKGKFDSDTYASFYGVHNGVEADKWKNAGITLKKKQSPKVESPDAPTKNYPHPIFQKLSDSYDQATDDFRKKNVIDDMAYALAGDQNRHYRQEIMSAVKGIKVPKSQAGMTHVREAFKDWISTNKSLTKSQLSMFGDEPPKVDAVKAPTPPKTPEVTMGTKENFIKPEHKLTSEDGTWKIKGDPTATARMHLWMKDKYKKKDIYTYGGLLASGHPVVDKIKELHGNNNTAIFDHFNKITGREAGKESGVGENQLRMSMNDSAGTPLGDKHFQVPDLSKEAKVERDSYPNGEALHRALNGNEVSPELHKWHKEYQFNDFHKNKNTGEPYQRSLYNNESESFGKVKANQGNNLSPKDMEKYDLLKQKYEGSEFNDTHKQRLEELDTKANKKMPLSDKFSPEDKEAYDAIQKEKSELTEKVSAITSDKNYTGTKGAELESHKSRLKELSDKESNMHNDYREKLGLHKGDSTGEKGFSYTEDMTEGEQNELADLKNKKEFHSLHKQYSQAPEEHHITKLLKYPMSSNKKVFDDTPQEDVKAPSTEPIKSEEKEPTKAVEDNKDDEHGLDLGMDPSQKIEEHFPTVGIQTPSSLQKTLKEYQHAPEESEKEYKPGSMVDFNGSKYSIDKDGGNYVLAKNLDTGKSETLVKGDLENYPTDKKLPPINKMSVQKVMEQHGENGISLEDLYSKMGFPDDAKGKDYIKKRLRVALLQLEHHHETGGYHEPIVSREVGQAHPKEKDQKEKGIMYKIAKSLMDFTAQAVAYIKSRNLMKSFMVELYKKEKSIYEKSLESKDIIDSLQECQDQEKSLINILDNIQAFTLKKSGIAFTEQLNYMLDETTEYLCKSGLRFDMLKSMDNGKFQKAVDAAIALNTEEENHAIYKYNKPNDNAENITTAGAEE